MTLQEKVGQTLCFGFAGTYPHPDILEMVEKYHVAGFRVTPSGRKFERYFGPDHPATPRVVRELEPLERSYGSRMPAPDVTAKRYAEILNTIRQRSLETGAGIPVYFTLDFEGNQNVDFYARNTVLFPHPMGLASSGDPELCRRVARVIGRQLRTVGIDWLHSPVLDVNTAPLNTEIGTRSYSSDPEEVATYAAASLRGFDEAGIIATGKHFPGRGSCTQDVHFGMATIDESLEQMHDIHLYPYKHLIKQGLPAIMLAHSIFPALDPEEEIATLSRPVIQELLREELGFDGVVMTDSFTMGGLVAKYEVAEAAVKCIRNGVDLILLKDENALRGEVYNALLEAVRSGTIPEDRLNEAVRHVLEAKDRAGLLEGSKGIVDIEKVETALQRPEHRQVEKEAAERSLMVLRNRTGVLPLNRNARILVAEEVAPLQRRLNNEDAYPGALYHALLEAGYSNAIGTDFQCDESFEQAFGLIRKRAESADVIVHTGFFERGKDIRKDLHARFQELGKPTVFVTNSPYPTIVDPAMDTVIVTFSPSAPSMRAAVKLLAPTTANAV